MAGNQTVAKVTDNALRVLAAAGLPHVDVVAGAAKPLLRPAPILCAEIHGETGLDGPLGGPVLPPAPHAAVPGKAPVVMFDRIAAAYARQAAPGSGDRGDGNGAPQRVALVATAALTNVALMLALYPEVVDMVEASARREALGLDWFGIAALTGWGPCRCCCLRTALPYCCLATLPAGDYHGRLPGGGQHGRRCACRACCDLPCAAVLAGTQLRGRLCSSRLHPPLPPPPAACSGGIQHSDRPRGCPPGV